MAIAVQNLADLRGSYVDLSFRVIGKTLPADHGYKLYSAIAHACPEFHENSQLSFQTISGIPDKKGKIYLQDWSNLRIRLPCDYIPLVCKLAGKDLSIYNHRIQLGIPQIFPLQPAEHLRSRIVVIKHYLEPDSFTAAAQLQLDNLGISATAVIPMDEQGQPDRKTIKIRQHLIVGFSLEVHNLKDTDSVKLQILGLGGRRNMACGFFTAKDFK
jgi:CRISPR-associated protein Cas6